MKRRKLLKQIQSIVTASVKKSMIVVLGIYNFEEASKSLLNRPASSGLLEPLPHLLHK